MPHSTSVPTVARRLSHHYPETLLKAMMVLSFFNLPAQELLNVYIPLAVRFWVGNGALG
jgi:hypothetical protein